MAILGIGVDIVHLPRLSRILSKPYGQRFIKRVLSVGELDDWSRLNSVNGDEERVRFLSVRWSVKEAAYKAMYPHHKPTWKDLTYTGFTDRTKPTLTLRHPSDCPTLGRIHVSVSHDGEYVVSQVVVEEL